jgi:hypothetical protein
MENVGETHYIFGNIVDTCKCIQVITLLNIAVFLPLPSK